METFAERMKTPGAILLFAIIGLAIAVIFLTLGKDLLAQSGPTLTVTPAQYYEDDQGRIRVTGTGWPNPRGADLRGSWMGNVWLDANADGDWAAGELVWEGYQVTDGVIGHSVAGPFRIHDLGLTYGTVQFGFANGNLRQGCRAAESPCVVETATIEYLAGSEPAPTPTPTPAATATPFPQPTPTPPATTPPSPLELPYFVVGTLEVNGIPAADGTIINAKVDGAVVSGAFSSAGQYTLTVPGSASGSTVLLQVDGRDTTVSFVLDQAPGAFYQRPIVITLSEDLETALAQISGQYTRVFWFNRNLGIWQFHSTDARFAPFATLTTLQRGNFYWILTTSDVTLTHPNGPTDLFTGWNIIAW